MRQDLFGRWLKIKWMAFVHLRHCLSGLAWYLCAVSCFGRADTLTTLPSRAIDQPGFAYHPSPADWRELPIYQVITDRFFDGDTSNNHAAIDGTFNPFSMDGLHGGDFAGLRQQLGYVTNLGFRAVWISPVYLNHHGAYHGYHILDFNRIDPHWGSLDDLRALIDEAHRQGMYVIIDVVFNHMARILTSDAPGFPRFTEETYPMRWGDPVTRFAPPFDDLGLFHGHGSINNWEDDRQNVIGDLQGLADLRTEDPVVRDYLLKSHLALIAATDCDGFRIDTAHHVELDFWREVLPRIKEGAAALGKTNFFMFAEALRGKDEDVSRLTRVGSYPSALYYPYYFTQIEIWGKRGPTRQIRERWARLSEYGPAGDNLLVGFIDNHDRARMLNESYLAGDTNRAKAALALLYASPSIPCVYYGTEQGFSGSKGHNAREPMFDPGPPPQPWHFDASHPLYRWIRALNQVRALHPSLVHGSIEVLHDEDTAGLFVFRRTHEGHSVTVVLNNSEQAKEMAFAEPLVDAMTGEPHDGVVPADTTLLLVTPGQFHPLAGEETIATSGNRSRPAASMLFTPDGLPDAGAGVIASNASDVLRGSYDPGSRLVYLAVDTAPAGYDRFLMVSYSNAASEIAAPWSKLGVVPTYDLLISDEGDSDYTSVRGTKLRHWSASRNGGVLEAVFELPAAAGREVFVRSALYETHDLGLERGDRGIPAEGMLRIPLDALPAPAPLD